MAATKSDKRRLSLPWHRSKSISAASAAPTAGRTASMFTSKSISRPPTTVTQNAPPPFTTFTPQSSPLLNLPYEIQLLIYSHIFTPWTMAVLPHRTPATDEDAPTLNLHFVASKLISGPPSISLLLVCKQLYTLTYPLYGSNCTGRLHLGYIYGWVRHALPTYLTSESKLQRFYPSITTLSLSFTLNGARIPLRFRDVFPNLNRAECRVEEGRYGPLLRPGDTYEEFLAGRKDAEFIALTRTMVNHFVAARGHHMEDVTAQSCVWGDEEARLDVLLIGSIGTMPGFRVGFHYRWQGTQVEVVARVVRNAVNLKYWEEGMAPGKVVTIAGGEYLVPQRFWWVPVA